MDRKIEIRKETLKEAIIDALVGKRAIDVEILLRVAKECGLEVVWE